MPPETYYKCHTLEPLRIQRIFSKKDDLDRELENLKDYFKNRNYDPQLIDNAMTQAKSMSRSHKTTTHLKPTVVMVIPFHPTNPHFSKTINQIWDKYTTTLEGIISKPITTYRRDILVHFSACHVWQPSN